MGTQARFRWLEELPRPEFQVTSLAIGVFDGVHRGHQALLAATRELSVPLNATPTALTFDPHPSLLFSPARAPLLLGTLSERASWLRHYGMEEVVVAPFDRQFAARTPGEFIEEVLVKRLRVRAVVVGEDFRFGCDRTGNTALLQQAGERHGFVVKIVPPVFIGGAPARSTVIRQLLVAGKVEEAALLLNRPYRLMGGVVQGRQLGRTLGFPTANLATANGVLIPGSGVYAGRACLENGETFRAAISIGTNPTVTPEARERSVEAYLLDGFNRDLYGQPLSLEFLTFLRPTVKFDSLDALIAQMKADVARIENSPPPR